MTKELVRLYLDLWLFIILIVLPIDKWLIPFLFYLLRPIFFLQFLQVCLHAGDSDSQERSLSVEIRPAWETLILPFSAFQRNAYVHDFISLYDCKNHCDV